MVRVTDGAASGEASQAVSVSNVAPMVTLQRARFGQRGPDEELQLHVERPGCGYVPGRREQR